MKEKFLLQPLTWLLITVGFGAGLTIDVVLNNAGRMAELSGFGLVFMIGLLLMFVYAILIYFLIPLIYTLINWLKKK